VCASGDERRARAAAESLEQIARERTVFAAAVSELGQDLTRPATNATRIEDGWSVLRPQGLLHDVARSRRLLHGRHVRGQRFAVSGTATRWVPRDTPGVVVHNDWDALGMRASGTHSISFENVQLPLSALRGGFAVGDAVGYMNRTLTAGLFHAAAALGVAESAHAGAAGRLEGRDGLDPRTQMLAAENVVDLSACRTVLSRAGGLVDEEHERNLTAPQGTRDVTSLFGRDANGEGVHRRGRRPHRRPGARTLGRGRLPERQPARPRLSRRSRHGVHAPARANRAYAFLGQLAAGREPSLH